MRRMIRNALRQEYYCLAGWSPDWTAALQFPTVRAAVDFAFQQHLGDAEVVLQIGKKPSKDYDVHMTIPLTP